MQLDREKMITEIYEQSAITKFFKIDKIDPTKQPEYKINMDVLDLRSPGLFHKHPGVGVVDTQVLQSSIVIIPTSSFDHESAIPLRLIEKMGDGAWEAHERRLKNATVDYIECCGWDIVQGVVSDAGFPVFNVLNLGEDKFTRFLASKLVKMATPYVKKGYLAQIWCSNNSWDDFTNWDIDTKFDYDAPLTEFTEKPFDESALYCGVPVTQLRSLNTGDVYANADLVYMTIHKPYGDEPDCGFVMPVRQIEEDGDLYEIDLRTDPIAEEIHREVRQTINFQPGFACINHNLLFVGVVNRTGQSEDEEDSIDTNNELGAFLNQLNMLSKEKSKPKPVTGTIDDILAAHGGM